MSSCYVVPLATSAAIFGLTFLLGCSSTCILLVTTTAGGGLLLMAKYKSGGKFTGSDRIPGKTVLITGANTGIGKETAKELARRGGRIIMACRDIVKGEEARREIIEETENQNVICKNLNLASFESIRAFSEDINNNEERIHILINNAGVMMCPYSKTINGLEMQLGVNHIGHFLLTNLLLDKLKASAPSRIIIVSSAAHNFGKINFDDVISKSNYSRSKAYGQSKLANLLHVQALAKRLKDTGVTVNGLHPGVVNTELYRHLMGWHSGIVQTLLYPLTCVFFKTPVEGAQTTLRLALDPALETVTGKYFRDCKEVSPNRQALDDDLAERLWKKSEDLINP